MKYLLLALCSLCISFTQAQYATLYFSSKEKSAVNTGEFYSYHFTAFDSTNKKLSYSKVELPGWLTFDAGKQVISGTTSKRGQYYVRLAVTNGDTTAFQSFMLTVCNKQTTKILCLGNSITNGTNKYNSYRRDLWKMLHEGKYNFDFIGSWSKHHWNGEVPNPDFDMDHDGHSGWTFPQILKAPDWDSSRGDLQKWIKNYTPDIVLIELGTNDVFQCISIEESMRAFSTTVKLLRQKNKNVKIFVAQIPPLGQQWAPKMLCHDSISYAQRIINYNDTIALFAKEMSTKASPVIAVDQYTGVNPAKDMYDDIHPNDKGELEMAKRWFAAIKQYIAKP